MDLEDVRWKRQDGKGKMEDGKGKRESGLICRRVYIIFEFGTRDNRKYLCIMRSATWPGRFPPEKARKSLQFPSRSLQPEAGSKRERWTKQRVKASMLPLSRFP